MSDSTRWLVTGATGLLGANAGRNLHHSRGSESITSIALNRSENTTDHYDETVRGDLTDLASLRTAVEIARPNVILHAGALASHEACESDPDLARQINVDATEALAAAATEAGSIFIYISTDAVFDGTRGDYRETDAPQPFSVYGHTKLAGEAVAISQCPDTLVIRTNFFGWSPEGTRSILEFFVNSFRNGTPVNGFTDFTVTSIYVSHLIHAIRDLVTLEHSGIVHVAARDSMTKFDFGRTVAEVFSLNADLLSPTSSQMVGLQTSRERNLSLNVSLCESLLGSGLPSHRDGLTASRLDEKQWRRT